MPEIAPDDRLPEGIYRVRAPNPGPMTLSGTNSYLVGKPAWVIDPGPADSSHLERVVAVAEHRGGVAGIALTHRHLDHAGGANDLRERTGAELGASPLRPAGQALFNEPEASRLELDVELLEGGTFGPLRVIETPGHAADHLSFLVDDVLFVGDTVLGEGSVFIPPEPGALASYLHSLEKLSSIEAGALCPGHGQVVFDPKAKLTEYIHHRLDRERRLLLALERGLRGREELLDEVWDDAPKELRPAAALTLEAHLDKLDAEGRLPAGVERMRAGA